MRKTRYEIDGRSWVRISRAAELLGTNAQGVRKLMTEGLLDWRQLRANSSTLLVDLTTVLNQRSERATVKSLLSPDPLKRLPKKEARRPSGGMFTDHHLRLTLPRGEDEPK